MLCVCGGGGCVCVRVGGGSFVVIFAADSCVSEPMNSITGVENKIKNLCVINQKAMC